MKQRIFAILLSLTMMFTLVPTAWAENNGITTEAELRTAIENATGTVDNPTVIELLSDIVLESKLVIDENTNISIEGNNHIISRSETNWNEKDKNIFEVKGNLRMADCTLDAKKGVHVILVAGGYLYAEDTNFTGVLNHDSYGAIGVNQSGRMDLVRGAIYNNESLNRVAVVSDNGAKCTLSNTSIYNNTTWRGDAPVFVTYGTGTLTITGGEIYENKNHYNTQNTQKPYDFSNPNDVNCVINDSKQIKISGDVYIHDNTIQIDNETPVQRNYGCGLGNSSYRSDDLKGICVTSPLTHDVVVAIMEWTDPTIERRTLFRGVDGYKLTKEDLEKVDITIGKWFGNTTYSYDKNDLIICLNEEENTIEACAKVNVVLKNESEEQIIAFPKYVATAIANPFSKNGYSLSGWKDAESETVYESDTKFTLTSDRTFYAQWYHPSTLTTNIDKQKFVVGEPTEFTFTTTANDDANIMVIGTSNFSDGDAIEKLEYYEVKDGKWYELKGDFGPSTGFPMSNATSKFRVTFKKGGDYTFTASMKKVDSGEVLCSTKVEFTVEKLMQTAPTVPTLKDRTYSSITLNTIEGARYRCNGGAWQTSPEFTGLTAGTAYTFEAYYPETDTYKASPASEKAEFSTLYRSSGSSSSSGSSYAVSAPSAKNGDVTVSPKNASKGDRVTVTVKPDSGYEIGSVTVLDSKGNELKLTDKGDGKYTFTMPGSKVTISTEFVEEQAASTFTDVPTDAYYAKAVEWAQKLGITNGKTDALFGSNDPCTRGQIVTFLWRAAGSPAPKGTANVPSDVLPGSYCYDAVAWALENGITNGLADGSFGVGNTCTRGQSVTFLYRALGTAPTTVNGFTDVAAGDFYAEAVAWAVENGVTNGTTDSTFSPSNGCTRAQIVTFLYRTMK